MSQGGMINVWFIVKVYVCISWVNNFLQQDCRESKKRLEEQVDELKKEVSSAEHQLQKNSMEIKVF